MQKKKFYNYTKKIKDREITLREGAGQEIAGNQGDATAKLVVALKNILAMANAGEMLCSSKCHSTTKTVQINNL